MELLRLTYVLLVCEAVVVLTHSSLLTQCAAVFLEQLSFVPRLADG